ncbi:hypothetical protein [Candidatus Flexifilum breve]|uniref:hypothetical protein n=1 Tax=Candidatus Flexifilum breve TaxID=3140694 RepID=UPI0031CC3869
MTGRARSPRHSHLQPGCAKRSIGRALPLTAENLAYLEALPTTFVIGNYTLAHGSPANPWEYILSHRSPR